MYTLQVRVYKLEMNDVRQTKNVGKDEVKLRLSGNEVLGEEMKRRPMDRCDVVALTGPAAADEDADA